MVHYAKANKERSGDSTEAKSDLGQLSLCKGIIIAEDLSHAFRTTLKKIWKFYLKLIKLF